MSVPFVIDGVYGYLAEAKGVIRYEDEQLVLDFRITDSLVGALRSKRKEIRIPLAELRSIELERGWLWHVFVMTARSLEPIDDIPHGSDGEVRLRCRRRHLSAAEELVSIVKWRIMENKLDGIVDDAGNE